MEAYGESVFLLNFVAFFISIIIGIVYAAYKNTLKYTWIFGCIAGFCIFTAYFYMHVLLVYDDISHPSYEAYKNWNIQKFIVSDVKRFFIWLGIGILNYLVFVKQNKLIKYLFFLGVGMFLTIIIIIVALSSVTTVI